MGKDDILLLLQKYQKIAHLLEKEEDVNKFDEIINFYKKHNEANVDRPKKKSDEAVFDEFTEKHGEGLEELSVHPDIKANRERIADFWEGLEDERKVRFTIFELNIIRFLLSDQYNKYLKKDKRGVIASVDSAVRAKKTEKSYADIKI